MLDSAPSAQPIEGLICAQLRAEKPVWLAQVAISEFMRAAEFHGVAGLLHEAAPLQWPQELRLKLRDMALRQGMWELSHRHAVRRAIAALAEAAIEPVLIKGTALAYCLFADASTRARSDTDALIPEGTQDAARKALERAGFTWLPSTGGSQATFLLAVGAQQHALDLHWRINNSPVLARLFSYDELRERATALPALADSAQGASRVDAFLLACVHRLTHKHNPYHAHGEAHYTADRLIWLYDIHLLARAFTPDDWSRLRELARRKGLRSTCLDGIEQARARFATPCPAAVLADFAQRDQPKATARYFAAGPLRQQLMDLRATGGLAAQGRFVRELVFPSRAYMRARFASSGWQLPWLYLRRTAAGAARRLARIITD